MHDDPGLGPAPGHRYAELVGGPLDGQLLDITGWSEDQIDGGVALILEVGSYGPGGCALYDPRPADPGRWDWGSDLHWPAGPSPESRGDGRGVRGQERVESMGPPVKEEPAGTPLRPALGLANGSHHVVTGAGRSSCSGFFGIY